MRNFADNPYAAPRPSGDESSLSVGAYVRIGIKGLIGFVLGLIVGALVSVVVLVVAILVAGGTLWIIRVEQVSYWMLACWTFIGLLGFVVFARREFHRQASKANGQPR